MQATETADELPELPELPDFPELPDGWFEMEDPERWVPALPDDLELEAPLESAVDTGKLGPFQSLLQCEASEVGRVFRAVVEWYIPWTGLETYARDIGSVSQKRKLEIRRNVYVGMRKRYTDFMACADARIVAMKVAIIFCFFHASEPASGPYDIYQRRIMGRYGPELSVRNSGISGKCIWDDEVCAVSGEAIDAFFGSDEFDVLRRAFYLRSYEDPRAEGGPVGAIMNNAQRFVGELRKLLGEGGVTRWHERSSGISGTPQT